MFHKGLRELWRKKGKWGGGREKIKYINIPTLFAYVRLHSVATAAVPVLQSEVQRQKRDMGKDCLQTQLD